MISRSFLLLRVASLLMVALLTLICVPGAGAREPLPNHLTKRVVGDYVYWSKYQNPPYGAAQIPYKKLTHINHGGVSFDANGTLSVPSGAGNEFLEPELNSRAHAAGVKVLLLLGGDFIGLEGTGAVQTLVDNVAAFEQQYGYDGVDVDWEYPETAADRAILVT
jgi:chitinase